MGALTIFRRRTRSQPFLQKLQHNVECFCGRVAHRSVGHHHHSLRLSGARSNITITSWCPLSASKRKSESPLLLFATLLTDLYDRTEDHLYSLAMVGARPVGVLVLFCIFSIEMQRTIRIDFPTCAELINLSLRLLERGAGEDPSKGREKSSKRPKIQCNFG